ncbi:hypothetical protein [Vibrio methylphosphonaticus]|uniref:hypothetical protein n=1 Tax=Vibrio methylphosphonaticus TaxID=2946866 RepID=UPI00202A6E64|nr:hypothetical protein [Vibrio methylphosphonaticus]MCL9773717.1 hypothetical protein [Vibrio methylphosphonaticus]
MLRFVERKKARQAIIYNLVLAGLDRDDAEQLVYEHSTPDMLFDDMLAAVNDLTTNNTEKMLCFSYVMLSNEIACRRNQKLIKSELASSYQVNMSYQQIAEGNTADVCKRKARCAMVTPQRSRDLGEVFMNLNALMTGETVMEDNQLDRIRNRYRLMIDYVALKEMNERLYSFHLKSA